MKVGVQARLKNGILWEAAKQMGSTAALAKHLGISPMELGYWINFRRVPVILRSDAVRYNTRSPEFWRGIESKLLALTGHTLDEIFPPEIRGEEFLNRQKQIDAIVEMPVEQLLGTGAVPLLSPAPDELLFSHERGEVIDHVLKNLRPRERELIRMRFGLNGGNEHTLQGCAQHFAVTQQRIRQIETNALRKLRAKGARRHLKQIV